jgi:hypothetical protein
MGEDARLEILVGTEWVAEHFSEPNVCIIQYNPL